MGNNAATGRQREREELELLQKGVTDIAITGKTVSRECHKKGGETRIRKGR